MKKTYENPVAERIEFDYAETVTACSWPGQGSTNNGGGNGGAKQTYSVSNDWYTCNSSLMPDNPCGYSLSGGKQVSNAYYDCT